MCSSVDHQVFLQNRAVRNLFGSLDIVRFEVNVRIYKNLTTHLFLFILTVIILNRCQVNLYVLQTGAEFLRWCQTVVVPIIYKETYYNDQPYKHFSGLATGLGEGMRLGPARLRQLRTAKGETRMFYIYEGFT